MLLGHISEILLNAFKYADLSKNNFLSITFNESENNDSDWLQMTWENYHSGSKPTTWRRGLEGIAENLRNLNMTKDEKFSMNVETNKNFVVTLSYKSELLAPNTETSFDF